MEEMNQVFVTDKQLTSALRRIEKNNLKLTGRSLTAGSMRNQINGLTSEVRDNGGFMPANWREIIKKRFDETANIAETLKQLRQERDAARALSKLWKRAAKQYWSTATALESTLKDAHDVCHEIGLPFEGAVSGLRKCAEQRDELQREVDACHAIMAKVREIWGVNTMTIDAAEGVQIRLDDAKLLIDGMERLLTEDQIMGMTDDDLTCAYLRWHGYDPEEITANTQKIIREALEKAQIALRVDK